jgi:hypothetical protein
VPPMSMTRTFIEMDVSSVWIPLGRFDKPGPREGDWNFTKDPPGCTCQVSPYQLLTVYPLSKVFITRHLK